MLGRAWVRGFVAALVSTAAGAAVSTAGCSREDDFTTSQPKAAASHDTPCPAGSQRSASGGCEAVQRREPSRAERAERAEPSAQGSANAVEAPSSIPAPAPAQPRCFEPGNPDRAMVFDWQREAKVDAALGLRLRGLTGAGSELKALAAELDLELKTACSRLAGDLGHRGAHATTEAACTAALEALRAQRQKLGAGATLSTQVHPSTCVESVTLANDCVKRCDGRERADARCAGAGASGFSGGRCSGTCDGACEARPPGRCMGTCEGSCESEFSGTCKGICVGTCDGKDMKAGGDCKGRCEGACKGVAKGECKGACRGGCAMKGERCDGQCLGACSQPPRDPVCTGDLSLSKVDAACEAHCQTRALRRASCSGTVVGARVVGASDAAPARQLESVLERHLPSILQIERHLTGRKAQLDRARSTVKSGIDELAKSSKASVEPILPCLQNHQRAAADAVAAIEATTRLAAQVTKAALAR